MKLPTSITFASLSLLGLVRQSIPADDIVLGHDHQFAIGGLSCHRCWPSGSEDRRVRFGSALSASQQRQATSDREPCDRRCANPNSAHKDPILFFRLAVLPACYQVALDAKRRYRIGGGQITPRRSYLDQGGITPLLRAYAIDCPRCSC